MKALLQSPQVKASPGIMQESLKFKREKAEGRVMVQEKEKEQQGFQESKPGWQE